MIVVADTSPICYLILIEAIEILHQLFDEVVIPEAVYGELSAKKAPVAVQMWVKSLPSWVRIESVLWVSDVALNRLDVGEKEAIILAERINADLIILDEKAARKVAKSRGLAVTGLLGILERASRQNLIDFKAVIQRLQKTSFRVSPRLVEKSNSQFSILLRAF